VTLVGLLAINRIYQTSMSFATPRILAHPAHW
jgi:hypothetical protein